MKLLRRRIYDYDTPFFRLHVINKENNVKKYSYYTYKWRRRGTCRTQLVWRCRCSTKRDTAIVRLLQYADVGTRQLGLSLKDSSSRVAWKTNLGLDNLGAVQQETTVFCFACVDPTRRKQPQNWSDSGRSSYGSSVQPELFVGDFWNMVSSRVLQEKTHW